MHRTRADRLCSTPTWPRFGILSILVLALAGCATLAPASRDDVLAQVAELERMILELQRKSAVNDIELARLRQQVAALEQAPAAAPEEASPAVATLPEPAAKPRRVSIEEADLEEPVDLAGGAPEPTGEEPSPPVPAAVPLSAAAQAVYDRAYTLYNQGQYLEAETGFQRFLDQNLESDLADNALYWIGECRGGRQDLRGALAAFRETVNRFPTGNKVPDALLKSGQVLEALGDTQGARAAYREVQRRFPESGAAAIAAERLDVL